MPNTELETEEIEAVIPDELPKVQYQTIEFEDAKDLDRTLEEMDAEGWGIIWQDMATIVIDGDAVTYFYVRLRRVNKPGIKSILWGD